MQTENFNHCYAPEQGKFKLVALTDEELRLVNLIRKDKGFGPVIVVKRSQTAEV